MTTKEKAKELVEKYAYHLWIDGVCDYDNAKQCALIAVDEIMMSIDAEDHFVLYNYWQKVKQEIEKL